VPDQSESLKARIERLGYFPQLCWEVLQIALAGEPVSCFLVQCEPRISMGGASSHLTALVLTPTRLICGHVDDHAETPEDRPSTAATTDAVALRAIQAVGVTHLFEPSPESSREEDRSVTLAVSWGTATRIELQPGHCGDEQCMADHGYSGTIGSDDIAVRISQIGDGVEAIEEALGFARALSEATSRS
jgi:hypothetical protein